jgi:Zn-dependent peptidase ImmA (M78 family)
MNKDIIVNGVIYKIEYISDIDMTLLEGCDNTTVGNIDYQKAVISIKNTLQENQKRKTLIHELVHAIRYEYGFPREKNEEAICEFICSFYDEITRLLKE